MIARGALIKPWIFREATTGYWDITAEERLALYRRYVELARAHWGRPAAVDMAAAADTAAAADPHDPDEDIAPGPANAPEAADEPAAPVAPEAPAASGAPAAHAAPLDAYGRERVREFLRWHVGFWVRYAPRRPDGTWPSMQQRESAFVPRSPLEALFARTDDAALDYITDQLLDDGEFEAPPAAGVEHDAPAIVEAG
jgi:hypothetical protein